MSLVRFNGEQFCKALEPGIVSFIVNSFKSRLEEKLNSVVAEVYQEMEKELPDKIKGQVSHALDPVADMRRVRIEVNFNE